MHISQKVLWMKLNDIQDVFNLNIIQHRGRVVLWTSNTVGHDLVIAEVV